LVASGHGLIEVRNPSQAAAATAASHSFTVQSFRFIICAAPS